ncbi:MAG: hypothetical protein WB441_02575 [Nocardioidaceae bacterium]
MHLTKYAAELEYHGLRRRELRARVDELRANLAESAADGGVTAALVRLGHPRARWPPRSPAYGWRRPGCVV